MAAAVRWVKGENPMNFIANWFKNRVPPFAGISALPQPANPSVVMPTPLPLTVRPLAVPQFNKNAGADVLSQSYVAPQPNNVKM
jgi:hypothetical protein